MADVGIIPSGQQIAAWRQRKQELEAEMLSLQRELAVVSKFLEAVDMAGIEESGATFATPANGTAQHEEEGNMTEAVEQIVSKHGKPMPKAELKGLLRKRGFKEERLGNYFYTVIMRLKQRGKIKVERDGSVGPTSYAKVFAE